MNVGDPGYEPLFAVGYGLRSDQASTIGPLDETAPVGGCITNSGGGNATTDLDLFVRTDQAPYLSYIGSPDNWGGTPLGTDVIAVISHTNINARTSDVNVQQDARRIQWTGSGPGQFYLQDPAGGSDLRSYLNADGAIVFDTIVYQAPANRTVLRLHCVYPCFSEVVATQLFSNLPIGVKSTVKVPLACLDASGTLDFANVNTPFLIYTDGAFEASFADVRWVPGVARDADAVSCASLQ